MTWHGNMWANINRSGHANEFHSHPGSFWSAVYYVDDGGIPGNPALGGELEFMDPRGALPVMTTSWHGASSTRSGPTPKARSRAPRS